MLNAFQLFGAWGRSNETPPVEQVEVKSLRNHPVSAHESRMCLCGHTHYWHGDRAVALCGAVDGVPETAPDTDLYRGPQCACTGFTEAL